MQLFFLVLYISVGTTMHIHMATLRFPASVGLQVETEATNIPIGSLASWLNQPKIRKLRYFCWR